MSSSQTVIADKQTASDFYNCDYTTDSPDHRRLTGDTKLRQNMSIKISANNIGFCVREEFFKLRLKLLFQTVFCFCAKDSRVRRSLCPGERAYSKLFKWKQRIFCLLKMKYNDIVLHLDMKLKRNKMQHIILEVSTRGASCALNSSSCQMKLAIDSTASYRATNYAPE